VDTKEIDFYLKKYDNFIKKTVRDKVKPLKHQIFQLEDIIQETRIILFKLIQERFDPSVASIDTFILTHTPYSVYKVITYLTRSLYYTGKYEDGQTDGRKEPRKEAKKIDDLAVHVDFMDFEPSCYPADSTKSLSFPRHYILISGTYILFDHLDKITDYRDIKDAFTSANNEQEITENIDVKIIKKEIRKRLTDNQKKIFDLIVADGENPDFTKGPVIETKYLGAAEIAREFGYSGASLTGGRWYINDQIKTIREIAAKVLKELDI
jgi:hypothetical protein